MNGSNSARSARTRSSTCGFSAAAPSDLEKLECLPADGNNPISPHSREFCAAHGTLERVRAAGERVHAPSRELPHHGVRVAFATDPEGQVSTGLAQGGENPASAGPTGSYRNRSENRGAGHRNDTDRRS
jgi:hypothetical protein